jgi:hypothetical protein
MVQVFPVGAQWSGSPLPFTQVRSAPQATSALHMV